METMAMDVNPKSTGSACIRKGPCSQRRDGHWRCQKAFLLQRHPKTANTVTPTFLYLRNPAARTREPGLWCRMPVFNPSEGQAGSS